MGNYWWEAEGSPSKPRAKKRRASQAPAEGPSLTFSLHPPQEAEQAVEIHRAGDPCPNCGFARLEYDGYFNLYCPICGFHTGTRGACT